MAGGLDFFLADVEVLDRQVLYFSESMVEWAYASPLSIFTRDAIRAELRRLVHERYSPEFTSPMGSG
jgi:hypothetical protein